jgi:perosamine synthetase
VYSRIRPATLAAAAAALAAPDNGQTSRDALTALMERYPNRRILLTDSGTNALHLALQLSASPHNPNRCVAMPAYACPDLGTAAIGAGFRIALYDVDPLTLEPDRSSLTRCLELGASHVVVTHLFGRIVDVDQVTQLATGYGTVVIEDAAQHGAGTMRGSRAGALADWSILSFGRGKGLNAGGGGALIMRDQSATVLPDLPLRSGLHSLKVLLQATFAEVLAKPSCYWVPASIPVLRIGETVYHAPATCATISPASARLLTGALDDEAETLAARRAVEAVYERAAAGRPPGMTPRVHPESESGALRFPVRVSTVPPAGLSRLGVSRSYPRTLAEYPEIHSTLVNPRETLPGADVLAKSLYTWPTHALLSSADLATLTDAIRTI